VLYCGNAILSSPRLPWLSRKCSFGGRAHPILQQSQLKAYPAGTLYSEPARTPHYAWAKDGEVILQVTAIGPTGNTPIPQKKQMTINRAHWQRGWIFVGRQRRGFLMHALHHSNPLKGARSFLSPSHRPRS
jgi:hypothetical protein